MLNFSYPPEKVKDFKKIFNNGKKFKTSTSQVIVLIEKNLETKSKVSFGILALKKIVGKKAVCRNKAKRRYRNGLFSVLKTTALEDGFHIQFIALTNKNTLNAPWEQVLSDIEKELHFMRGQIQNQIQKEGPHENS